MEDINRQVIAIKKSLYMATILFQIRRKIMLKWENCFNRRIVIWHCAWLNLISGIKLKFIWVRPLKEAMSVWRPKECIGWSSITL